MDTPEIRALIDARRLGLFVLRVPGSGCVPDGFILRTGLAATAATIRAALSHAAQQIRPIA